MTVAIGLVCQDGVLVAADSMGSDLMTARKSQKVRALERAPVVWTASGSVYVMEEVTVELGQIDAAVSKDGGPLACFTEPSLGALRSKLQAGVHKGMKQAYKSALASEPLPPGSIQGSFVTDFLMLGYSAGVPWFLEFAHDGQINWHTEPRFYATGSGGPFATVAAGLMSHYLSDDLTLEDGKLLAYRTIDTTIEVSNQAVGPPVQIAVCDDAGARILPPDEIDELGTAVERWKTLEAEVLGALKTGDSKMEAGTGALPTLTDSTTGDASA